MQQTTQNTKHKTNNFFFLVSIPPYCSASDIGAEAEAERLVQPTNVKNFISFIMLVHSPSQFFVFFVRKWRNVMVTFVNKNRENFENKNFYERKVEIITFYHNHIKKRIIGTGLPLDAIHEIARDCNFFIFFQI